MSYALTFGGEIDESVRRTAREQLEAAAAQLEQGDEDPARAVHGARKRLKKTRALLRLTRPALPKATYRDENRALRDRGRALSAARDADVLVDTTSGLAERFAGQLPAATFDTVRDALQHRAGTHRQTSSAALAEHVDALRALAAEADRLPLRRLSAKKLSRAMTRAYADGRDAFKRADRDPTAEHLHEWRKRVKDLWYQQRLVQEAWPAVLKAQAHEAKALSQLLGDDHDLVVLADTLEQEPALTAGIAADRDALLELIDHRRDELLNEARALGRRVYAEKPKAFERRARRYLKSAGGESAQRTSAARAA